MPKGTHEGAWSPDRSSRAEAEKEIRWVYTTSLPPEEGQPDVQLVLGVPQDSEWLRPDADSSTYRFELPVNIVAGNETVRMTASGSVRTDSSGKVTFRWMNLEQHASDHGKAWVDNHDRIARQAAMLLSDAAAEQCGTYLAAHHARAAEHSA